MPYGTIRPETELWIRQSADQNGIAIEALGLNATVPEEGDLPSGLFEVSIIIDGALDESFYIQTMYEVNLADWLADDLDGMEKGEVESWAVEVHVVTRHEGDGAAHYRVDSEGYSK